MLRGEPPAWRSGALSLSESSCSIGQDFPISVVLEGQLENLEELYGSHTIGWHFSIWTCSGATTPPSCSHVLWDGCLGCGFVNAAF